MTFTTIELLKEKQKDHKLLKICGLTRPEEADWVREAGGDLAGFVQFFPKSKRNISVEAAKEIMKGLSPETLPVAVTVSPTLEEIREIEEAGFALLQIHGDLSDVLLEEIRIPVLRAFNVNNLDDFPRFQQSERVIGYVFDAQVPGSGKTFDWSLLSGIPRDEKLSLLAGGIGPENAAQALFYGNVDGIDASSSVENDNGIGKNREKILALSRAVRRSEGK